VRWRFGGRARDCRPFGRLRGEGEPILEPEFYTSLMKIWMGTSPADHQLKDALPGQSKPV
jgi:hypothetical protein